MKLFKHQVTPSTGKKYVYTNKQNKHYLYVNTFVNTDTEDGFQIFCVYPLMLSIQILIRTNTHTQCFVSESKVLHYLFYAQQKIRQADKNFQL